MLIFSAAALANPGPFAGTWTYASGDAGRANVEAAVEKTSADFNFAFRPIVRTKLRSACAIDETISVSGADGRIEMAYTGDNARTSGGPSDGTKIELGGSMVSFEVKGKTLVVDGANEEGGKRSVYTLTGDDAMRVTHTITSPRLSTPLVWTLDYTRKN
jgi:hypothetical protein